jgi:hypothetical protein
MATKKKRKNAPRVPASVTRFLKRMNPSKMKGVTHVRVQKFKDGAVKITPVSSIKMNSAKKGEEKRYSIYYRATRVSPGGTAGSIMASSKAKAIRKWVTYHPGGGKRGGYVAFED